MLRFIFSCIAFLTVWAVASPRTVQAADSPPSRPMMREFMGLNVHTVGFKADLYAPVCRRLRDYHPMVWDTGRDTRAYHVSDGGK